MSKIWGILLGCALLIGVAGCGGSSSPPPPPPPPPMVGAFSTAVPIGTTQLFTAANFSGAVTWSINPAVGTIDASGLYHAPATFPSPNSLTVTATAGSQTASVSASVVYPNDNAGSQSIPVKLGTSGGNVNDTGATVCCIGTMGSLWTRGTGTFILSNNHVLDKSSFGTVGDTIAQPGPNACFPGTSKTIANLTQGAALAPTGTAQGRTGASPSNTDSAIAQVTVGGVDPTGTILDLGAASSTSIAAAPPSSTLATATLGLAVAKSGRTTGLTCSTVGSINTNVQVAYETSCGSNVTAFNAQFSNQVVINGGTFSAGGDSGSLIVTQATARPVALLYGGSTTDTVANPIADVIAALTSGANVPAIVGGADHPVSCAPTATGGTQQAGTLSATVPLSATERQRVTAVHLRRSGALMQDSAVSSVSVGASPDSPGEGALVIHLSRGANAPVPVVMDGVRTRVVYDDASGVVQPSIGQVQIDHATAVKEAHVADLMGQPGIQGVGVSISGDNPAETAISIYVIEGVNHPVIPPVIDGIRTKIFVGSRFKAF